MVDSMTLGDLTAANALPSNGWAALGDILAGGTRRRAAAAGAAEVRARAGLDELMAAARIKQQEAIARDRLADSYRTMGVVNPEAAAGVSLSGVNFKDLTGGLGDMTDQALESEAAAAARAGDVDAVNRLNAVRAKHLIERTKIESGQAYDPYTAPTAQTIVMTPLGDAMIGEKRAAAAENTAQADAARANIIRTQADTDRLHAETDKVRSGLGDAVVPADDAVLRQARQRIAAGADPRKVAAYLASKGYPGVAAKIAGNPEAYAGEGP